MDEDEHQETISPPERRMPGILRDWLKRSAFKQRIQCSAIVIRRSLYKELGGFHQGLLHAVDWEMRTKSSA